LVDSVANDINGLNSASRMDTLFSGINENIKSLREGITQSNEKKSSSDRITRSSSSNAPITLKSNERTGVFQRKKNFNIVKVINREDNAELNDVQEERKQTESRGSIIVTLLEQIKESSKQLFELTHKNSGLLEKQSDIAERTLEANERQSDLNRAKIGGSSSKDGKSKGGLSGIIVKGFSAIASFVGGMFNKGFFKDIFVGITERFGLMKNLVLKKIGSVFSVIVVADAIVNLIKGFFNSEDVAKAFDKDAKDITLSERISNAISSAVFDTLDFLSFGVFSKDLAGIKKTVTNTINDLILGVSELGNKIISSVFGEDTAKSLSEFFNDSGSFLNNLAGDIEKGFNNLASGIATDIFNFFFDPDGGLFGGATKTLIDFLDKHDSASIIDLFTVNIGDTLNLVKDLFFDFFNVDTSGIVKLVSDYVGRTGELISSNISGLFDAILEPFGASFDSLKEDVTNIFDDLSFSSVIEMLTNLGKFIIDMPANLIKSSSSFVADKVKSLLGDNAVSNFISSGFKAISDNLVTPSEIIEKGADLVTGGNSKIESSKPSTKIKNNVQLSKDRFNDSNKVVERVIVKEKQPIVQQAQQQRAPLIRRTDSDDMRLSFVNSGVADGI